MLRDDVQVDSGGLNVVMAEELLDCFELGALL